MWGSLVALLRKKWGLPFSFSVRVGFAGGKSGLKKMHYLRVVFTDSTFPVLARPRFEESIYLFASLSQDMNEMLKITPSWNTDQGVHHICESLRIKTQGQKETEWGGIPLKRMHHRPIISFGERFEYEHTWCDPKDGELCLSRVKSGETLMEARRGSDVQIDLQTWV